MKIWSNKQSTPAAVITYAGGNSNVQPILFTTQFGHTGTVPRPDNPNFPQSVKLEWVIKSIQITNDRNWSTSTAMIVLTVNLPDGFAVIPKLPSLREYRGGNYGPLTYEDEIRIYMGYVTSPTIPITADMLDEYPITFDRDDGTQVIQDPLKPLCPAFWGFIDKVEFDASDKGVQVMLSCRDRTRIFADTRILSIPSFQGSSSVEADLGDSVVGLPGDRVEALLQLARGAAGSTQGENVDQACICWKDVVAGKTVRGFLQELETNLIKPVQPQEDPAAWVREATLDLMNDKAVPRFHIWAERPPLSKSRANSTLQVINKTPLEVVDFLAKTEERPIDFFASHVNGDFVFGPRVIDFSGFEDASRSYRTYFFKSWPKELEQSPPSPNQMVIKMKAVSSTLATFNRFLVIDSTSSARTSSLLGSVKQTIYSLPWSLQQRDPAPPCRAQIIYDGGLGSYDDPDLGALIVGLSQARIWSRDVTGVQLTLVGDPTWYPGEAFRVYNTFLHDDETFVVVDGPAMEQANYDIKEDAQTTLEEQRETEGDEASNPENILAACTESIGSQLAERLATNPGRAPTSSADNTLILPTYKARTIQHTLIAQGGSKGFSTTVIGVSDY